MEKGILTDLLAGYKYDKDNGTITVDGEEAKVFLYLMTQNQKTNQIYVRVQEYPDKPCRVFYFCYTNEIIEKAYSGIRDYIISIEPFQGRKDSESQSEMWSYSVTSLIGELLESAKKKPEIGIYKKVIIKEKTKEKLANLVIIRAIENGERVTKYFDAYLASSDSRTFRDLKAPRLAQRRSTENETLESSVGNLDWPRNLLVFGAPGTGKSHCIKEKIKDLGLDQNMRRVTFYEDYSYEKFVGAYIPYSEGKKSSVTGTFGGKDVEITTETPQSIQYRFVPGIFLEMIVEAKFRSGYFFEEDYAEYVLVIEEINRANAASVFGDFFQLLDRNNNGISEYSIALPKDMRDWIMDDLTRKAEKECGEKYKEYSEEIKVLIEEWLDDFKLPPNLYIWATMNSADQGVYPMDAAFKRRWSYIYRTTQETRGGNSVKDFIIRWRKTNGEPQNYKLEWDVLKTAINERMERVGNIEEDRFVGPYFFNDTEMKQIEEFTLADANKKMTMPDPLTNKLFQYLRQDVFRNNPTAIFKEGKTSMSKIREAMNDGEALNDILIIENDTKIDDGTIMDCLKPVIDELKEKKDEESNSGD